MAEGKYTPPRVGSIKLNRGSDAERNRQRGVRRWKSRRWSKYFERDRSKVNPKGTRRSRSGHTQKRCRSIGPQHGRQHTDEVQARGVTNEGRIGGRCRRRMLVAERHVGHVMKGSGRHASHVVERCSVRATQLAQYRPNRANGKNERKSNRTHWRSAYTSFAAKVTLWTVAPHRQRCRNTVESRRLVMRSLAPVRASNPPNGRRNRSARAAIRSDIRRTGDTDIQREISVAETTTF